MAVDDNNWLTFKFPKKQFKKKGVELFSDTFHCGNRDWRLSIYPNGYEFLTTVAVFVRMHCTSAAQTQRPQKAWISFQIVNQKDPSKSILCECVETLMVGNKKGISNMLEVSTLTEKGSGFLENSQLVVKVRIERVEEKDLIDQLSPDNLNSAQLEEQIMRLRVKLAQFEERKAAFQSNRKSAIKVDQSESEKGKSKDISNSPQPQLDRTSSSSNIWTKATTRRENP